MDENGNADNADASQRRLPQIIFSLWSLIFFSFAPLREAYFRNRGVVGRGVGAWVSEVVHLVDDAAIEEGEEDAGVGQGVGGDGEDVPVQ